MPRIADENTPVQPHTTAPSRSPLRRLNRSVFGQLVGNTLAGPATQHNMLAGPAAQHYTPFSPPALLAIPFFGANQPSATPTSPTSALWAIPPSPPARQLATDSHTLVQVPAPAASPPPSRALVLQSPVSAAGPASHPPASVGAEVASVGHVSSPDAVTVHAQADAFAIASAPAPRESDVVVDNTSSGAPGRTKARAASSSLHSHVHPIIPALPSQEEKDDLAKLKKRALTLVEDLRAKQTELDEVMGEIRRKRAKVDEDKAQLASSRRRNRHLNGRIDSVQVKYKKRRDEARELGASEAPVVEKDRDA